MMMTPILGDGHEPSTNIGCFLGLWRTSPAFGIGASAHGTWCVSFLAWDQPYNALVGVANFKGLLGEDLKMGDTQIWAR
jgi:hypothetical protein